MEDVIKAIKESKKPVVVMDGRFDYDALCSGLLVAEMFKKLGQTTPPVLYSAKLPHIDLTEVNLAPEDIDQIADGVDLYNYAWEDHDAVFIVDCSSLSHLSETNDFDFNFPIKSVVIDHHGSNNEFGDVNLVRHFGSTTSVLYYLYKELGLDIDERSMHLFMLGQITDTGGYQFDTVKGDDLRMAAELVDAGYPLHLQFARFNFNLRLDDVRFKSYIYRKYEHNADKAYGYVIEDPSEFEEWGINSENVTSSASDLIKPIKGNLFVFTIRPLDNQIYKLSFRSHELHFDAKSLAGHFGGGGHFNAAGATISGYNSIDEALEYLLQEIDKYLDDKGIPNKKVS